MREYSTRYWADKRKFQFHQGMIERPGDTFQVRLEQYFNSTKVWLRVDEVKKSISKLQDFNSTKVWLRVTTSVDILLRKGDFNSTKVWLRVPYPAIQSCA